MKGAIYDDFRQPLKVQNLPDPNPKQHGVVIEVKATGICRSDWHGWMGHDTDIHLPHVPGHELAGIVVEVGKDVKGWRKGDRVTLPFSCGCGSCVQCASGNQQICDNYFQPGFTAWGSFAEYVAIDHADVNLVRLPDHMSFEEAAVLGCRFITAYRGIVHQGKAMAGEWLAVHGCGGVGLSAIMIGHALGMKIIAVDIDDDKLLLAERLGATASLNTSMIDDVPLAVKEITDGGVHLSMDALGSVETCQNSIWSLLKRGRHIQIGLMRGDDLMPPIPISDVIANELEIIGSHGMQAHKFPEMFELIRQKEVPLVKMIGRRLNLEKGAVALTEMDAFKGTGIAIINQF